MQCGWTGLSSKKNPPQCVVLAAGWCSMSGEPSAINSQADEMFLPLRLHCSQWMQHAGGADGMNEGIDRNSRAHGPAITRVCSKHWADRLSA